MVFVFIKQVGKSELKGLNWTSKKRWNLRNVLTLTDGRLRRLERVWLGFSRDWNSL